MVIKTEGKIFVGLDKVTDEQPYKNDAQKVESLGHLFIDRLRDKNSDTVLFIDAASGREWTGAQLSEEILNVACALIDLFEFTPGTAVCISYDHSVETIILAMAVIVAGGLVACAYDKDPYAELLYQAERIEPRFLFCHRRNIHWAKQLEIDLGSPVRAVVMDGHEKSGEDGLSHLNELMNYDSSKSKSLKDIPFIPKEPGESVAFITMSSGTTGKPKAIPVTHRNCVNDMLLLPKRKMHGVRVLSIASLDYVSGRIIITNAIMFGYTAVVVNSCEPTKILAAVEKYGVNAIYMGAALFYSVITHPDVNKYNLSSIRNIFPMGAKIIYLDELREFLYKHPNITTVTQGFGASELSGAAMKRMTPEEYLQHPDNCGQLQNNMEAKIVDKETGQLLGINQHGLLCIRGTTLLPGYYDIRRTKLDSAASPFINDSTIFDSDGFYMTGDIAYFNDKEELHIVGREKELMWCRGSKKVLPYELEELIEQHPAVDKVCVIGIDNKHELTLHCPRAFITVKSEYYTNSEIKLSDRLQDTLRANDEENETLKHKGWHKLCTLLTDRRRAIAEDLMQYVSERIGWEKQLTGGIVILDEIPTSRATGKIDKRYLRSLTLDQVEIYGDRSC